MSSNLKVNTILPSTGTTVTVSGISSVTSSISAGSSITATTFYGSGANLTSLPAQATVNNNADNRVITGGSGVNLYAESGFTYDGTIVQIPDRINLNTAGTYIKSNQIAFNPTGTAYLDHYRTGQDIQIRMSTSSSLDTTGPTFKSNGNLAFASGKGIDFSAAGNAGGMTNELLSDYEEGTWTPSFTQGVSGGSYSQQAGLYTKVGRLVMISARIDGNGLSANGDHLLLGGLPFTTTSGSGTAGGIYFAYSDNMYSGSSGTNLALTIIVNNNATVCEFFDGDGTQKRGTDFYDVNRNIHIVGTYHASS